MKILVISHSSVVGSYRGKLNELAKYPNVNVSLIVPPKWNEGCRMVKAETNRYSSFSTYIVRAYRIGYIASYFFHPIELKSLIKNISPEVIYLEEEPWSVVAWQTLRLARIINAKVVFFTWENIWRRYKAISESILKYVLRNSIAAVAGNKDAEMILQKRGFNKPVVILPQYGVDVEIFKKRNDIPVKVACMKKPVIGYIGRLEYEKGIHILLEAVSKIQQSCSVVIIGNGTYKEHLVSLTKALKINNRVKFIDSIPNEEIPNYLSGMDVLVLPSLTTPEWKEQFGRVLIEAMACEVPVIGSDSGAIPEVIGDAGLIYKENDLNDLSQKLDRILFSNQKLLTNVYKGRQKVKEQYSNQVVAKKLFDFIQFVNS